MSSLRPIGFLLAWTLVLAGCGSRCYLKSDEQVMFYPGYAYSAADQKSWNVVVQGRVIRPDPKSIFSNATLQTLNSLALLMPDVGRSLILLQERLRPFAVQGRPDTAVPVQVKGQTKTLSKTSTDGYFVDQVALSQNPGSAGWLDFGTEPCRDDARQFSGRALVIPPTGLSVISDVEGTLQKEDTSEEGQAVNFAAGLIKERKAAPGMPSRYAAWSREGALFHYVSSRPWEWLQPVQTFLSANSFPEGSLHLQKMSWGGAASSLPAAIEVLARLIRPSTAHTTPVIEELLQRFPQRQFILVGSSAEPTPEIYANLARRYSQQIRTVFIRQIPGSQSEDDLKKVFEGLPSSQWKVLSGSDGGAQTPGSQRP